MLPEPAQNRDYPELARQIKAWARDLGFSGATIGRAELPAEVTYRTGHFARNKLSTDGSYTLVAADEELMRNAGILLSDALDY